MILQSVLGAEGLSLAFRHIISSLLWYCSQHSSEEVLHEVIICVGYFTVNNPDNQVSHLKTATYALNDGCFAFCAKYNNLLKLLGNCSICFMQYLELFE